TCRRRGAPRAERGLLVRLAFHLHISSSGSRRVGRPSPPPPVFPTGEEPVRPPAGTRRGISMMTRQDWNETAQGLARHVHERFSFLPRGAVPLRFLDPAAHPAPFLP